MTAKRLQCFICSVAVLAAAASMHAADNPVSKAKSAGSPATDVEKLKEQFSSRREQLLAERQALIEKLKTANEAQRKEILSKLQDQQKALIEAARAQAKQIVDDMRNQRRNEPPTRH